MAANEKDLSISMLADIYGSMLTKKQLEILRDYYDYDSSLAEIAEKYHIARQSVKDSLSASKESLIELEEKLNVRRRTEAIAQLTDRLLQMTNDEEQRKLLLSIKSNLIDFTE